ncbi:hypothetical protein [Chryseobacterium foetidum]|uniref:hypothetical protein n=1 Tax=Chryseobacterium foetidum TaxID=2951057 RepID=UPI0021CAB7BE|nr:hypothetical protein [Chryseobacterium foetidum]
MISLELYKEEVKELTELFRNEWKDVQEIATENGLDPTNDFLLSFIEGEDESETCLFFSKEKGLYLYERKNENITFKSFLKEEIEQEFPQVRTLDDINNFDNW